MKEWKFSVTKIRKIEQSDVKLPTKVKGPIGAEACDPDQIKGFKMTAESSCLVLLGLYPQVNISECDSRGQTTWRKAIFLPWAVHYPSG